MKAKRPDEQASDQRRAPVPSVADFPGRTFTADDVTRMVEAGIVGEDEPLELIEGVLVIVSPQGPIHSELTRVLGTRLARAYGDEVEVGQGTPIDVGGQSLPEPDVSVVRTHPKGEKRHPKGSETLLAVEIVNTSHEVDRFKIGLYARGGVPVYWFVDVPARRIEVHEDPQPDGRYRIVRVLAGSDTVTPPGTTASWRVDELLP